MLMGDLQHGLEFSIMRRKRLEQTWRWYGPNDPVSLEDIKQAGATGIVTALHHIPHGEVWPVIEIVERKNIIEKAGLTWSVVESVPVHEAIKTGTEQSKQFIENYKQTLKNLADCGIRIITYNFMPVLDWTRTDLEYLMTDGSKALNFNWFDLAFFDIYVLKRENAELDYCADILKEAKIRSEGYSKEQIALLVENILMGIPSEKAITLEDLTNSIKIYQALGKEGLRKNLLNFLAEIKHVCEENNVKMSIHPDDPPYDILGLPRIMSEKSDYEKLFQIESSFNGVCFCTGSLGARRDNNLLEIFDYVKDRIYFTHLRNVKRDKHNNFYEADHLEGDVDMYEIMVALTKENERRTQSMPFRPDHGHQMLDDLNKKTNPGYSAIGRLRGLAELRGLELGILGSR